MTTAVDKRAAEEAKVPPPPGEGDTPPVAWEEIDTGRFMPRRVRGSCRGRVLG